MLRLPDGQTADTVPLVDSMAHRLTGALIDYGGFRQRGGSECGKQQDRALKTFHDVVCANG